jgi:hypothetical protein
LALQVGDGAIVIDVGTGPHAAFVPMSGEYANMTSFVTDEDAVQVVESRVYSEVADKVAAFTDGLQPVALNQAENTPHIPFFEAFFNVMDTAEAADEVVLQEHLTAALLRFLGSEGVNQRTDDDKTLALALRRDGRARTDDTALVAGEGEPVAGGDGA